MIDKNIQYKNSSIHYRVIGAGRPVMLIHGFGEDGSIWDKQVEFLKDQFRLIIPDLPGSGRSEMIPDMSIEGMADLTKEIATIELLKFSVLFDSAEDLAEGAKGLTLLGHSMGGYITLAFAEKYPELLSSFGLLHSSAFADSEEKKAARLKSIEFIQNNGAYEFLKSVIPGLFYRGLTALSRLDPNEPSDPYIDELIEKGKQFSDETLIQYYRAMIARPDRTEVLKNFNGPILFIIGQHDKAVPFDDSMKQCYLPHQSHIHILRQSAHMGMHEEAEGTNNILLQFLR